MKIVEANGRKKDYRNNDTKYNNMEEERELWMSMLSEEEKKVIMEYSSDDEVEGDKIYENINNVNRIVDTKFKGNNLDRSELLSTAVRKSMVPDDITVYRGVGNDALGHLANLQDYELIGKKKVEMGFMSTSLRKGKEFKSDMIYEIKVPKGSSGAYIRDISPFSNTEDEVLFDKMSLLEIENVRYEDTNNGSKKRVIEMRLIKSGVGNLKDSSTKDNKGINKELKSGSDAIHRVEDKEGVEEKEDNLKLNDSHEIILEKEPYSVDLKKEKSKEEEQFQEMIKKIENKEEDKYMDKSKEEYDNSSKIIGGESKTEDQSESLVMGVESQEVESKTEECEALSKGVELQEINLKTEEESELLVKNIDLQEEKHESEKESETITEGLESQQEDESAEDIFRAVDENEMYEAADKIKNSNSQQDEYQMEMEAGKDSSSIFNENEESEALSEKVDLPESIEKNTDDKNNENGNSNDNNYYM
ncbi:ADP-ribosyltransferase [Clostridium grantii]|uniref:ADP-ribosyltransferase n=1 Tax=Clostridium grantii TaxID=40575 RepID=UPI0013567044|nr:ADP-ribosyltransferase [Clostridium grantii]